MVGSGAGMQSMQLTWTKRRWKNHAIKVYIFTIPPISPGTVQATGPTNPNRWGGWHLPSSFIFAQHVGRQHRKLHPGQWPHGQQNQSDKVTQWIKKVCPLIVLNMVIPKTTKPFWWFATAREALATFLHYASSYGEPVQSRALSGNFITFLLSWNYRSCWLQNCPAIAQLTFAPLAPSWSQKKYVPNARIRVCKLKIKQGMYWTCQAPGKTYFLFSLPSALSHTSCTGMPSFEPNKTC